MKKFRANVSWKTEGLKELKHYEDEYINVPAAAEATLLHPKYKASATAVTPKQSVGKYAGREEQKNQIEKWFQLNNNHAERV